MATQPVSRKLLIFAMVLNPLVYAIIVFIIGVTLPTLTEKFGLSDSQKGTLFLVQNLAILISILSVGPIMDKFGRKPVVLVGALLIAGSVVAVGVAPSFASLLAILFVLGLGGGCNNIGGSALIADLFTENTTSAFNWLGASFGIGAILIPLLGSLMIGPLGLFPYVIVLGLIAAIPLVIFAFAEFPKSQEADQFKLSELVKVISNPLVFLLGAVLFFYVAVEISTVGWLKDYLINKFNLTDKTSGFVLTGFSSMMMVGRLSAGFILKKIRGVYLIVYCALLSVIGLAAMILTGNLTLTVLGVALVGLAFAPIYPTSLGTIGENFSRYVATTMSVVISFGFLGSMLLPFVIGLLGGDLLVIIFAAGLMLVSQLGVVARVRRKARAGN